MSSSISQPSQKGTVLGASLLISGTCIGAGMLAIPLVSGLAGPFPCLLVNLFVWLFMYGTGLLLLEVTLHLPKGSHYLSLASHYLGQWGKVIGGVMFLFLYYAIMTAYASGIGPTLIRGVNYVLPLGTDPIVGSALFCLIFGAIIFLGSKTIDRVNTVLMVGLALSFVLLLGQGVTHIQGENFGHSNWPYLFFSLPILFATFGYHNIIPTISEYLDRDRAKLKRALFYGTLAPFVVYSIWQMFIMGILTQEQLQEGLIRGRPVTELLASETHSTAIAVTATFFAFFALVTSTIGVSFSLVDFLSDGMRMGKQGFNRLLLCVLVFVPPAFIALGSEAYFSHALQYAGGFGEAILNGLFPVMMAWVARYILQIKGEHLVPGGRLTLAALTFATLLTTALEIHRILFRV